MFQFPSILLSLITLPLLAILVILVIPETRSELVKGVSLWTSIIVFLISLFLWLSFDLSTPKYQFVEPFFSVPYSNINVFIGVDGISLFFVILTTFLIPLCLLASWDSIKFSIKEYNIAFLLMGSLLICVFTVLDVLFFYIFFEAILIPMFLVIGIWGSRERKIRASLQFFVYTLVGSVLMLLAILTIYAQTGTTDIQVLQTLSFSQELQIVFWLAFFASFAVKVPMLPVHLWLPEAHSEAPTAGSVILAGILLKMGGYGFLRFSIPIFPDASIYFTPLVYTLSAIAVIYTSLTTLRQVDMKRLIAYSSVAHMGFVTIGMFTMNIQGIEGSIFLMLSHGIVSSALFLCVGVVYDRHKTRIINYYSGLTVAMPVYSLIFLFFILANMGLPGTSSFVSEFMVLAGAFKSNIFITVLIATGGVWGAAYSLWLYNRTAFGNIRLTYITNFQDIDRREFFVFLPCVILVLVMGIYPEVFLNVMHASVQNLVEQVQ
jgi:proton-translocating NADH-quinone oxidoreductase chain M|tara:strand:- start:1585 stop:3054 length:1470 start_codon:yes stop_codon:yes gene_type:complete